MSSAISLMKEYPRTRFTPEVVREAVRIYDARLSSQWHRGPQITMKVTTGGATWTYPDFEEFLSVASHGESFRYSELVEIEGYAELALRISFLGTSTLVEIAAPERGDILAVINFLDSKVAESMLPEQSAPLPPPTESIVVFIGHGHSPLWRDLKDHLQDKHDFRVEAYEVGARGGHSIRDVLENMLERSSIAFLVMTAEDETADGAFRARQNVVHEIGLFQGRLGFSRGIVLLEENVEEFSNIAGIEQVRFSKSNIREVFGDVIATIRREFPRVR
jgi:predicted nucleotide-binding protein